MDKIKVIDLFCGAGGLSYGLSMAGYEIIAAIDSDRSSLETYKKNHDVEYVLNRKLNRNDLTPSELKRIIGCTAIDFVVGSPPCQGFSKASMNPKARPNYGKGSYGRRDSRRSLYLQFFDYISYFKPRAFLMENVPSLRTKTNGYYRKQIKNLAEKLDYSIEFVRLNAADFGVPQKRNRLFVIGVQDRELVPQIGSSHDKNVDDKNSRYSVGDAILDLPVLKDNDGTDEMDYDLDRIREFEEDKRFKKEYSKWARKGSKKIYHHVSRPHQKRDLKIFNFLAPGETSAGLPPSKQKWIIYSMKSFKDRYRRQALLEPSTTIMAHISKDGLYYVHPTQLRSLTPREAARLQSFPDSFEFSKYRTHTYKQIGNAVPPLLAKAIGTALNCLF